MKSLLSPSIESDYIPSTSDLKAFICIVTILSYKEKPECITDSIPVQHQTGGANQSSELKTITNSAISIRYTIHI